jgi:hypothetical protein
MARQASGSVSGLAGMAVGREKSGTAKLLGRAGFGRAGACACYQRLPKARFLPSGASARRVRPREEGGPVARSSAAPVVSLPVRIGRRAPGDGGQRPGGPATPQEEAAQRRRGSRRTKRATRRAARGIRAGPPLAQHRRATPGDRRRAVLATGSASGTSVGVDPPLLASNGKGLEKWEN